MIDMDKRLTTTTIKKKYTPLKVQCVRTILGTRIFVEMVYIHLWNLDNTYTKPLYLFHVTILSSLFFFFFSVLPTLLVLFFHINNIQYRGDYISKYRQLMNSHPPNLLRFISFYLPGIHYHYSLVLPLQFGIKEHHHLFTETDIYRINDELNGTVYFTFLISQKMESFFDYKKNNLQVI